MNATSLNTNLSFEITHSVDNNDHYKSKGMNVCSHYKYLKGSMPVTILASFPGSGNTWTRHLLQRFTGREAITMYWQLFKYNNFMSGLS